MSIKFTSKAWKTIRLLIMSTALHALGYSSGRPSISKFFNEATFDNMEAICREVYHPNIEFVDPVHHVTGIEQLIAYYRNLYENLISIRFDVEESPTKPDEAVAFWTMHLAHKRINGGEVFSMDGVSRVRFVDNKIIWHRDFFDLGEMVYERIPIVGWMIRTIKNKLGSG